MVGATILDTLCYFLGGEAKVAQFIGDAGESRLGATILDTLCYVCPDLDK